MLLPMLLKLLITQLWLLMLLSNNIQQLLLKQLLLPPLEWLLDLFHLCIVAYPKNMLQLQDWRCLQTLFAYQEALIRTQKDSNVGAKAVWCKTTNHQLLLKNKSLNLACTNEDPMPFQSLLLQRKKNLKLLRRRQKKQ